MLLTLWAGKFFIVWGSIAGKCTENVTHLALAYQMPKVPTGHYDKQIWPHTFSTALRGGKGKGCWSSPLRIYT